MDKHPNSKIITIMRTESFQDAVQTGAKDFMSMSIKSIGSYWKSVNARIIGTGLDFNEQETLLPHVINCEAHDRDFKKSVAAFYSDLLTKIPFSTGRDLEIGMLVDNSLPMGARIINKDGKNVVTTDEKEFKNAKLNLPIEIMDYIRYRHAKEHPQVAPDRDSALGDSLKLYFIFDPEVADKSTALKTSTRDAAMQVYLTVKDNTDKVDAMLLLLGVDPRDFTGASAPSQKAQRLRVFADTESEKFNRILGLDNFELRVKIEGFLVTGVFKKQGDRIFEASTNKLIAVNMDEAVKTLQDPAYSENLTMWSGAYQDIMAKPKPTRRKVTA
jgi:hypothetical protein